MKLNKLAFFADLHCASRWGLTHPKYWNEQTSPYSRWLWESFLVFSDWVGKCDLVVNIGDTIDGKQRRSGGTGLVTLSAGEQVQMAIDATEPLMKNAKAAIRVTGTPYHEDFDGAMMLWDQAYHVLKPETPDQQHVVNLDLGDGVVINIKHAPEGESAQYDGTSRDRELIWSAVAEVLSGIPHASILMRAHVHKFTRLENEDRQIITCPCWCLQQPYALTKKQYRWIPQIGGLMLVRDKEEPFGWRLKRKMFTVPTPRIRCLTTPSLPPFLKATKARKSGS